MHLQTLQLATLKLPEMISFYQGTLQCNVREETKGFVIDAGLTQLSFVQSVSGSPTYHFAFTIPWNQVITAMQWVAERTQLLELAPGECLANFSNWNAKAFYFFDPAGNVVEFIAREPLGIESNGSFSGASIFSVSEIGMVTDDVNLACRQLEELWAVPLFAKQPPTPNFAAAGDDHGLFIVVKEGRNWYPTQQPAIKAPVKAVFTTLDGKVRSLELG